MSSELDNNRHGLMKLMLRLPALRGQLQLLSATNADMFDLCGAFEHANATLERLRGNGWESDGELIREYEILCLEIEGEIIEMCSR